MPLIRAHLSSQGGLSFELVALEYAEWMWRSAIIFTIMGVYMKDEKMTRLTGELSEMFKQSHALEKEIKKRLGAIGYEI